MLHKLCHILLNILHNIFIKNEWQWVLLLLFFFYTTCKIAESFKHRLQYREKIHLTRRLLSSRLTFMLNELRYHVISHNPIIQTFSVNKCLLQTSHDTAPLSSWLPCDTKAELTLYSMWKSLLHENPAFPKCGESCQSNLYQQEKKKKKKIFARVQRL